MNASELIEEIRVALGKLGLKDPDAIQARAALNQLEKDLQTLERLTK